MAGYDAAHRTRARQLKAAMRDGQPCARGGEPLYRWQLDLPRSHPRSIHADHLDTPRVLGGHLPDALTCAHHNSQHGARLGNRLRGHEPVVQATAPRAEPIVTSRDW